MGPSFFQLIILLPFVLLFGSILPSILAYVVAKKKGRSTGGCALVAFLLGLTFLLGWFYLLILVVMPPKEIPAIQGS